MKKRIRKEFSDAISFDDFMAHADSASSSSHSIAEMVAEGQHAEQTAKRKDRELKAAKQKAKRTK